MTVWRWITGRTSLPIGEILPLAGALDVDPTALFECSAHEFEMLCLSLLQEMAAPDHTELSKSVRWAYDLIAPCMLWPPKRLANRYFQREWHLFDFKHHCTSKQNVFQRILIAAAPRVHLEPQVWHFAFKETGALRSIWRPYGVLLRDRGWLRLFHCRGSLFEWEIDPSTETIYVETWFGTGTATFRVASLHQFRAELLEEWDGKDECLRFPVG